MIVICPVCPGATVPPDGATPNQLPAERLMFVFHLSGLLPLLVMVTTWPVGLGSPRVLLKLRLSGEAPITGSAGAGGDCTNSCTMTVCVACPVTKEIAPVYVFGARPPILTLKDTTVLAVPFN